MRVGLEGIGHSSQPGRGKAIGLVADGRGVGVLGKSPGRARMRARPAGWADAERWPSGLRHRS